jgi:hypothetical protein
MIQLTWRQFRTQALLGSIALAIVAAVLLVTGPHLVAAYHSYLVSCRATDTCGTFTTGVLHTYQPLRTGLPLLVIAVPAVLGIFWGAPLVAHELETGTFRLAWTQSVTRRRWLATKLAVVGLSSVGIAGLLALMASWWANPDYKITQDLFSPGTFSTRGLVPFGYAAFAFALGVCSGVILRRTLPAMAVTLIGFAGARLAVTNWIRPHLSAPSHLNVAISPVNTSLGYAQTSSGVSVLPPTVSIPNAWIHSTTVVNQAGQAPTQQYLKDTCPKVVDVLTPLPRNATHLPAATPQDFQSCTANIAAKFHEVVTYHPASRYWTFQWYETAIFVAATVVLVAVSFWWIRHRLA